MMDELDALGEDFRKDELKKFFHDLCASTMCEPLAGLDSVSFREAIIDIGIGCSPRSAKAFCRRFGQKGRLLERHFLKLMRPWILTYKDLTILNVFKKALFAHEFGTSAPKVKERKVAKMSILQIQSRSDLEVLSIFFEDTSDISDPNYVFPEYRDEILPHDVDLSFNFEVELPFTFDTCIKLFLLQECYYSSVQHSLNNGLDDPKLTPWGLEGLWFRRDFTCTAKIIDVPSYIPVSAKRKTPLKVITRLKRLRPGAQIYHFCSETPEAPCGRLFFMHEIWEVRQVAGKCKIRFMTGVQWRESTWLKRAISIFVKQGSVKAAKLYFDAILAKFSELTVSGGGSLPENIPIHAQRANQTRHIPIAAIYSVPLFLLFVEFSFPALDLVGKVCVFAAAFSVLAFGVNLQRQY